MAKSKVINELSTTNKLSYIIEHVCRVDENRIEQAVLSIIKDNTIDSLLRIFSDLNNNFASEEERLMENEQNHNKRYANDDNGKYSTGYTALECIKTSVYGLYRILNKFTPDLKPSYCYSVDTKEIEFKSEHSFLVGMPFEGYLFETKTPRQKRLIQEICNFVDYFERNIQRCKKIIDEEALISKDQDRCVSLLDNQIQEIYEYLKGNKIKKSTDEYVQELLAVDECPCNAVKYFHKLSPKQLVPVAVGMKEKQLAKFTPNERKAFGNDEIKINTYRKVVNVVVNEPMKVTGELMTYVYMASDCNASASAFYNCFVETYTSFGGTQDIITYIGYNKARKNYCDPNSTKYLKFQHKIDLEIG